MQSFVENLYRISAVRCFEARYPTFVQSAYRLEKQTLLVQRMLFLLQKCDTHQGVINETALHFLVNSGVSNEKVMGQGP